MLNNYYFDDGKLNIGPIDSYDYLSKEYNYTFTQLQKEMGLSYEEMEAKDNGKMGAKEFVDNLMWELRHQVKSNMNNILLSDKHPEVI